MTRVEFDQWLDGHCGCFPGLKAWVQGMPGKNQATLLGEWWGLLQIYPLDAAKTASRQLWQTGGCPYGDHPVAIQRLISAARRSDPVEFGDMGPSILDATQAQRDEGREVIAAARAAMCGAVTLPGKDGEA